MSTLRDYPSTKWCEDCRGSSMVVDFEAGLDCCDDCFERARPEEFAEWVKECEEDN